MFQLSTQRRADFAPLITFIFNIILVYFNKNNLIKAECSVCAPVNSLTCAAGECTGAADPCKKHKRWQ